MKRYLLIAIASIAIFASCKDDQQKFSVIRDITLKINGAPYTALPSRILYIYDNNGNYKGNFDYSQKFSLDNGTYKMVAVTNMAKIPVGNIVNDTVAQNPTGLFSDSITVSDVLTCNFPSSEPLVFDMRSRCGFLRIKSVDAKPSPTITYDRLRITLNVKRSAYLVFYSSYIDKDMSVVRDITTNNGIGVDELFTLFPTKDGAPDITMKFEYYSDNRLVASRSVLTGVKLDAGKGTQINLTLNDPNPKVINNFNVTFIDTPWTNELIKVKPPTVTPEGYTLVPAGSDLGAAFDKLNADASADAIKLYLESDDEVQNSYTMGSKTPTKSVSIMSSNGARDIKPLVTLMGNFSFTNGVDAGVKPIDFNIENISLTGTGYLVNNGAGATFTLGNVSFKNCNIYGFPSSFFRTQLAGARNISSFEIDNCRIFAATSSGYAILTMTSTTSQRLDMFKVTNSTFVNTAGIIAVTSALSAPLSINISNNTFFNMGQGNNTRTLFDIQGQSPSGGTAVVKNNLFAQTNITNYSLRQTNLTQDYANNYKLNDVTFSGSDAFANSVMVHLNVLSSDIFTQAPAAAAVTKDVDLTIKDKTSVIYTGRIGDPRWLK